MAGRQRDELISRCTKEERVAGHQESADSLLGKGGEGRLDLALTACFQYYQVDAEITRRNFRSSRLSLYKEVVRVNKHSNCGGCGHQFMQQFECLWDQFHIEDCYARHIPARPREAFYEAILDRIGAENKNDWNRFRRCLGGQCRRRSTSCDNHGHLT